MLSAMQVFNGYIMPLITERFPQAIDKFNAASNNTITLSSEGITGSFFEQSFYNALHSSKRRVNRFAARSNVAETDLTQGKHVTVKVAGGFGPLTFEPSQMTWLQKPTQEGLTVASDQFVEALMADQLNTAVAALVAATSNNAAVTTDVSGASIAQTTINTGLAKFGDASASIRALVMTGMQYHKLVGDAIANANSLYEIGGIAVREGSTFGQGRAIIVTDAPALTVAGTPNKQIILGLTANAIVVKDGNDVITNVETKNGGTRIYSSFQADYTFSLDMKGYSWDVVNGGQSPDDTAIGTGSNWDQDVASHKHTAGVIIIGDEA